eukprot:4841900-Amphidinium_carterae.1
MTPSDENHFKCVYPHISPSKRSLISCLGCVARSPCITQKRSSTFKHTNVTARTVIDSRLDSSRAQHTSV